jgi:hypothetical protein
VSAEADIQRARGRHRPAEVVSGYLSALAIFAGVVAIAWHPLRLSPLSMLLALLAAAMAGPRNRTLARAGVGIAALCFFLGMTVSVITSRPLW